MDIWYIWLFLPIIGGLVQFYLSKKPKSNSRLFELLLLWYLGITVGIGSLFAGLVQIFSPEMVAQSVGWPNTPFLREVGVANISYGILGVIAVKYRSFWAPSIIAFTIFMWGAAMGHIYNILQTGNLNPGNAGYVLYLDIIIPLILIALFIAHHKTQKSVM